MTREEEILNKAIDYSEIEEHFLEYDDCGDICDDKCFIEKAFIEGAKWADINPNKKLVYTKHELLDMGFGFDLNGNIVTPEECYESAQKYTEYRKKKLIDKACNWLRNQGYQEYPGGPMERLITDEMINQFIKTLEE